MRLEDYKANIKTYRQWEIISGAALLTLMFAAGLATVFVAKRIDRIGFDTNCVVGLAASYPLIAALMFFVMAILPRRRMGRFGLTCPVCNARLIGVSSQAVIATGRCARCGSQVLESP